MPPTAIVAVAGWMVTLATTCVIVNVDGELATTFAGDTEVSVTVAVTCAVPVFTAVATPLLLMVATFCGVTAHTIGRLVIPFPDESVTVAAKVCCEFSGIVADVGFTTTLLTWEVAVVLLEVEDPPQAVSAAAAASIAARVIAR